MGAASSTEVPERAEREFNECFRSGILPQAAVVKTSWVPLSGGEGGGPGVAVFDTSAPALEQLLGTQPSRGIAEAGSGTWRSDRSAHPLSEKIYTLDLPSSRGPVRFGLAALHIIVRELPHWIWVSLWWSDDPASDFGADRPSFIRGVWANYKMCTTVAYDEGDPDSGRHYIDSAGKRTLADSLRAVGRASAPLTWCSNPFIERGAGNARSNCIGCHQHAGTRVDPTRTFIDFPPAGGSVKEALAAKIRAARTEFPYHGRLRSVRHFPANYLFLFDGRGGNYTGRMRDILDED